MRGLSLIDHLRFRLSFGKARRDTIKGFGFVALLVVAFGIVGRMDYEEELRQEAEAAQARFAAEQAALLACLNSGAPGYYRITSEGHRAYLVCSIHEITDENVHARRS